MRFWESDYGGFIASVLTIVMSLALLGSLLGFGTLYANRMKFKECTAAGIAAVDCHAVVYGNLEDQSKVYQPRRNE